jgi:hypothetical protein
MLYRWVIGSWHCDGPYCLCLHRSGSETGGTTHPTTVAVYQRIIFCVCDGSRNRCYGRTAALRLIVQPVMKMIILLFFLVMEHRWNEIDRGKPKYSGGKTLSQCHFVHQKSHIDTRDRTRVSVVRDRRLTA